MAQSVTECDDDDRAAQATSSERSDSMPVVDIEVIEGVFTDEEKRELVERLTEALLEIGGEPMRPVTHVLISETPSGAWAVGGRALNAEDVNAMRSSNATAPTM
jgi:4-oxalocrotonate tautomerase